MSEYVFLYRGGRANASAEQMQETLGQWMAWFKEMGAKGQVKDPGHPLDNAVKIVNGPQNVSDGPFAEAKDVIGGFSIVVAADLAEAAEIAKGCPIFEAGGSVEVRPVRILNM